MTWDPMHNLSAAFGRRKDDETMSIKFDRLLCPFVGCYHAAKCNSDNPNSVDEARANIAKHRGQSHRGASSLLGSTHHPKWMHEAD